MSTRYRLPSPILQSIGVVAAAPVDRPDAAAIEHKPVAAAVVTLSQQEDDRIAIFHETMTASDETEFPLVWLIEQELVADVPTLIAPGDATLLLTEAAAERHFVELKLARLLISSEHAIDVAGLVGEEVYERALCRRLRIPTVACDPVEAAKVWTWYPREARVAARTSACRRRLIRDGRLRPAGSRPLHRPGHRHDRTADRHRARRSTARCASRLPRAARIAVARTLRPRRTCRQHPHRRRRRH